MFANPESSEILPTHVGLVESQQAEKLIECRRFTLKCFINSARHTHPGSAESRTAQMSAKGWFTRTTQA